MPVNAPNDNLDVLAPSFNLKNINDEMVSLDNAKGLNGTVVFLFVIIAHMLKQLLVD